MRARKIEAPRCPVHVGAQMVVIQRSVPAVLAGGYDDSKYSIGRKKKRWETVPGKFYKCSIPSCARVERVPNEFEDAA